MCAEDNGPVQENMSTNLKVTLISSIYKIVSLLVENSLFHFRATHINVAVDLSNFYVEVSDNGCISCLSETFDTLSRYGDVHGERDSAKSLMNTVCVSNIFEKYPLRRKTINPQREQSRINDFIVATSLLHHSVQWAVTITSDVLPEWLLLVPKSESVLAGAASNISALSATVLQAQNLHHSLGSYTIDGVISLPTADHCYPSTHQQFLFVNRRWHSSTSTCLISSTLGDIYEAAIPTSSSGPESKHHQPSGHPQTHPFFILNVECSEDSVTVLNDSDKGGEEVVFHNELALIDCVRACLFPIFQVHAPQCLWVLRGGAGVEKRTNDMITSTAKKSEQHSRTSSISSHAKQNGEGCNGKTGHDASAADCPRLQSHIDVLFHYGFLSQEPINLCPSAQESEVVSSEYDAAVACDNPCEDSDRRRVCASRQPSSSVVQDDEVLWESEGITSCWSAHRPEVTSAPVAAGEAETEAGGEEDELVLISPLELCREADEDQCDRCDDREVTEAGEGSVTAAVAIEEVLGSDFSVSPGCPGLKRSPHTEPTECVVSKSTLAKGLAVLSQVDDKFIIAVGGDQILAADQHAVHERVLLEEMHRELKLQLPIVILAKAGAHEECLVDHQTVRFMENSGALLRQWGFQHFSFCKMGRGSVESSLVKFHKLPVVVGEALTSQDFVEFMALCLQQDAATFPEHLKAPPAVRRILASKSCRNAVKFGDSLSPEDCCAMLRAVGKCVNPFQCAHGRPSIVPLVSMRPVRLSARKRIMLQDKERRREKCSKIKESSPARM